MGSRRPRCKSIGIVAEYRQSHSQHRNGRTTASQGHYGHRQRWRLPCDTSYQKHFGKSNPDAALIAKLRKAGVEMYVCGQALSHRGHAVGDVRHDIRVAQSAMTKLVELQAAGYGLIP